MKLNLFEELGNNFASKDFISKFIKELNESLNNQEEEKSVEVEEILEDFKLNRKYRGEFFKAKNEILKDFGPNQKEKLIDVLKELKTAQEKELNGYRQEGGVYKVVENIGTCIYLQNIDTGEIFGEVKFSEYLYKILSTNYIVRYENGEYVYDEDLTDKSMS